MVLPAQASNGSDPYSPAMMTAPAGQISFDGEGAPPGGGWDILNRASGYIDRRSAREQGFELRTGRVDGAETVHHAQGRIGGHERVRSCFQGNGCQHRVEGADLDVALEEPKAQPEVLVSNDEQRRQQLRVRERQGGRVVAASGRPPAGGGGWSKERLGRSPRE